MGFWMGGATLQCSQGSFWAWWSDRHAVPRQQSRIMGLSVHACVRPGDFGTAMGTSEQDQAGVIRL